LLGPGGDYPVAEVEAVLPADAVIHGHLGGGHGVKLPPGARSPRRVIR
jgi:hypothetical protein